MSKTSTKTTQQQTSNIRHTTEPEALEYRQDRSLGLVDLMATLQIEAVRQKGVAKVHIRTGAVV